jgi:hypothetical protein
MGSFFSSAGRRCSSIEASWAATKSSSPMLRTNPFTTSSPVADGRSVCWPAEGVGRASARAAPEVPGSCRLAQVWSCCIWHFSSTFSCQPSGRRGSRTPQPAQKLSKVSAQLHLLAKATRLLTFEHVCQRGRRFVCPGAHVGGGVQTAPGDVAHQTPSRPAASMRILSTKGLCAVAPLVALLSASAASASGPPWSSPSIAASFSWRILTGCS